MSDFKLQDVAALAGVSISTVSRVLRGIAVKPEMEAAVKEAVERLSYEPNGVAQALRAGRTGILGLVVPDVSNPWFAELAQAIEYSCRERELGLVLCNSNNRREQEEECLHLLWNRRVDGVLLVSVAGQPPQSLVERVRRNWPVVAFDSSCAPAGVDVVMADNHGGMTALTEHLVTEGYRRFGWIHTGSALQAAQDRDAAATATLAAHGLRPLAEYIGDFTYQSGYDGAAALLSGGHDLDVLIVENDLMAVGALQYCAAAGIDIPRDVAIAGFDDMTMASWLSPALTTVRQNRQALADTALEMMLSRIASPERAARRGVVECSLQPRASTARSAT